MSARNNAFKLCVEHARRNGFSCSRALSQLLLASGSPRSGWPAGDERRSFRRIILRRSVHFLRAHFARPAHPAHLQTICHHRDSRQPMTQRQMQAAGAAAPSAGLLQKPHTHTWGESHPCVAQQESPSKAPVSGDLLVCCKTLILQIKPFC